MTDTMIERVAAALEERRGELSGWRLQRCYAELARAAIEAMLAPNQSMKDAAARIPHARDEEIYQAMIDAALQETKG